MNELMLMSYFNGIQLAVDLDPNLMIGSGLGWFNVNFDWESSCSWIDEESPSNEERESDANLDESRRA